MMSEREAIERLASDGPMTVDIYSAAAMQKREDAESDPENFFILLTARIRLTEQIQRGKATCLICEDVSWSADMSKNTVRLAGLAVAVTEKAFRDPDADEWAMLAKPVCEHCAADLASLRVRALDALKQYWPSMHSTPVNMFTPTTSSKH